MRILWVKLGGLWPLTAGGRLRSFHILRCLAESHAVTVMTTHAKGDDPTGLAEQLPGCELQSFPHEAPKQGTPAFAAALARSWLSPLPVDLWRWRVPALRAAAAAGLARGDYDLCVADFLASAANLPLDGPVPVVLFEHNVEHAIWRRLAETERRALRRAALELEWRKLRRFEARACARAPLTLAVSEEDGAALAALAPQARIAAIPTGVDVDYFHRNGAPERPASIVFCGSMDWYPNEDAVVHFVDTILPLVRREVPDAAFTIVGRKPSGRLRAAAARSGAHVTGTVDDVRPYVAEASVCVVPLRVGGGTRLKILEALAMRKAVVSTRVGAEGLPLHDGRHFLAADAPDAFARAVVAVIRDPALREQLGSEGGRLVRERHSWGHVAREFEAKCKEVLPCA